MCTLSAILLAMLVCASSIRAQPVGVAGKRGPASGQKVFSQCTVCHEAAGDNRGLGPGLKGLYRRPRTAKGKPMNDASLRALIDKGGQGMPPYRQMLSAEDKDDLILYLKTL
jgi:cytochrome c2